MRVGVPDADQLLALGMYGSSPTRHIHSQIKHVSYSRPRLTQSTASTSAPCSSSSRAVSIWSPAAATCRGV